MKILCKTLFDCTATGVTGNFRISAIPFRDNQGKMIENVEQWNYARNQQRNWETLNQLISLRTQPLHVGNIVENNQVWTFEFEVEQPLVYSITGAEGDLSALINECAGVPMITGLGETQTRQNVLIVSGPEQNVWFEPINNQLGATND